MKMIISCGGSGRKDGQVQEPCILANPKDAGTLVMFFAGMKLGGTSGAIGKAWANVAEPFVWHEDANNPILRGDPVLSPKGQAPATAGRGSATSGPCGTCR